MTQRKKQFIASSAIVSALLSGVMMTTAAMADDIILLNGKIQTMDDQRQWAEALCIKEKRVHYVGSNDGAQKCMSDESRVIDLNGQLVLPGFMDSHMHIFYGSVVDVGVNLSLADTMDKLVASLKKMKELNPGDEPLYARGWQNFLFPSDGPRKELLDEIFGDRVVMLGSVDGHSKWFSSAALREAGVDKTIEDPQPGVRFWERDQETGELLGTTREGAGDVVTSKLLKRSKAIYEERLKAWLPRANASGLTGVFDAGMGAPSMEDAYEILTRMDTDGDLSLRVFGSVRADSNSTMTHADYFKDMQLRFSSDLVKPAAIKLMADGVPEAHTAYMLDDYRDTPGSRGMPMVSPEKLTDMVLDAEQKNVPVHIHAIGDAAVRMSLDAIQAAQEAVEGQGPRHAIAHMDYVNEADIPRFAEMDVIPQTSIQWATVDPSYDTFVKYVGNDIHDNAYPIKSIMDAGGRQTFGTDWPAAAFLSTYKPLIMLETAVTRRLNGDTESPERGRGEGVTVMRAVEALTRNVAYQLGRENHLGSLEKGKLADLIVLDQNIFEILSHNIHKTNVNITIVNGKIVHQSW